MVKFPENSEIELTNRPNTPDMWLYMEILMNTKLTQFCEFSKSKSVDGWKALDILSLLMFTNVAEPQPHLIPGLDSGTNSHFSCIWKFL